MCRVLHLHNKSYQKNVTGSDITNQFTDPHMPFLFHKTVINVVTNRATKKTEATTKTGYIFVMELQLSF